MTYAIFNLQERGSFFIGAQTEVYEGMIVGQSARDMDMEINPTKNKNPGNGYPLGWARERTTKFLIVSYSGYQFIKDEQVADLRMRLGKKHLKSHERKHAVRAQKAE